LTGPHLAATALGALKTNGKTVQAPHPDLGGSSPAKRQNNVQTAFQAHGAGSGETRFILPS
jgi:hypothetical protein